MIQMYNSIVKYMESSDIWNLVEIHFIDVTRDMIENYPYAFDLLKKGYAIPLVAVNGRVLFYGGIPYEMIYREVEKCLSLDK